MLKSPLEINEITGLIGKWAKAVQREPNNTKDAQSQLYLQKSKLKNDLTFFTYLIGEIFLNFIYLLLAKL